MESSISYIPDLIEDVRIKCQEELEEVHGPGVVELLENSIMVLRQLEEAFLELNPSKANLHLFKPSEISPKSAEPWD